jgi:hypothetical protein
VLLAGTNRAEAAATIGATPSRAGSDRHVLATPDQTGDER